MCLCTCVCVCVCISEYVCVCVRVCVLRCLIQEISTLCSDCAVYKHGDISGLLHVSVRGLLDINSVCSYYFVDVHSWCVHTQSTEVCGRYCGVSTENPVDW